MKIHRDTPHDSRKPTTEQISAAAFHLYLENGCREGYDLDDWLRAEELLTQKLKTVAKVPIFEPERETVSRPVKIQQGTPDGHPVLRNEGGSGSREGIQEKSVQSRAASRRFQSRRERPVPAMQAA